MNRREAAGLIETLTDVDEFLRTPGTWALLEAFYRDRRGSACPGCDASLLIDMVGLTLWSLQRRAPRGRGPQGRAVLTHPVPARPIGAGNQEPQPRSSFPAAFSFHF